jgi:hypothetical protein
MIEYEIYLYAGGILFLSFLSTTLMTLLIITKKRNRELEKRLANREEIANESYVKFLNESRDWAYGYIEDVQAKLLDFSNKVEPQLNYYNTYGQAVQGPHTILVEEINKAYMDLKAVLPEDNKEK